MSSQVMRCTTAKMILTERLLSTVLIFMVHTDDQELNPATLIQAELATGVDLNGNGTTAVSVTSKITTETVSGLRRALYQTNSGFLVSTMDGLATKPTLPDQLWQRQHQRKSQHPAGECKW